VIFYGPQTLGIRARDCSSGHFKRPLAVPYRSGSRKRDGHHEQVIGEVRRLRTAASTRRRSTRERGVPQSVIEGLADRRAGSAARRDGGKAFSQYANTKVMRSAAATAPRRPYSSTRHHSIAYGRCCCSAPRRKRRQWLAPMSEAEVAEFALMTRSRPARRTVTCRGPRTRRPTARASDSTAQALMDNQRGIAEC